MISFVFSSRIINEIYKTTYKTTITSMTANQTNMVRKQSYQRVQIEFTYLLQ